MLDVEKLMDGVHDYIARALSPLVERVKALESVPAPMAGKDGAPGKDGARGSDAADGRDGKDAEPVTASQIVDAMKSAPELLDVAVAAYLAENPPPSGKDGADGRDGKDADPITDEQIGNAVASHLALNPPAPGRDGRDGLPGIKGADGKDGVDGRDGLGFDDLTVEDDGDGTATITFARGEQVKTFAIHLPRVVDKGVYRPDGEFRKGDGVTWGGSFWIAQKDAPAGKPGESGDTEWRLAVKRGRDGKDGAPGRDFTPPKPVKL